MGLANMIRTPLSGTFLRRAAVAVAIALPLLAPAAPAAAAQGAADPAVAAQGAARAGAVPARPVPAGPARVGTVPTGPAAGAESATAAPRAATSGPHCTLGAGDKGRLRCFATFRAAIAHATGGRVTTAPTSATAAATDPAFTAAVEAPAVTAASVLVGIEYSDLNYGGATLSLYAAGSCDASSDADYRFASLPAGWNDRISSFKSYSNCAQQLFNSTNFGSALTIVINKLSYVGAAANDRASSVTFN